MFRAIIIGILILFSTILNTTSSFVQNNDCGNGLIQRLSNGLQGWINLDPPLQGVKVRTSPGGEQITKIQPGTRFTIIDDPSCMNNISWWKIHVLGDNPVAGWIAEGDQGKYFVDPLFPQSLTTNQQNGSTLSTEYENLLIRSTAPIIDLNSQYSFLFGGGGAIGEYHCNTLSGGVVYYGNVGNYVDGVGDNCFFINVATVTDISIALYQPNGTLYSQYVQPSNDFWGTPSTSLTVPNYAEAPSGNWTILVNDGTTVQTINYKLEASHYPGIGISCDGLRPIVTFSGFQPNEKFNLYFLELKASASATVPSDETTSSEYDFYERYKWDMYVNVDGNLIGYIGIPIKENDDTSGYYFAVSQANRNWRDTLPEVVSITNTETDLVKHYDYLSSMVTCGHQQVLEQLSYGELTTGSLQDNQQIDRYTFQGRAGDSITINAIGADGQQYNPEQMNVSLRLLDEANKPIAESDNALNPRYGKFDSEIKDFVLPKEGQYTIEVSQLSNGFGNYTLTLENSADMQFNPLQ